MFSHRTNLHKIYDKYKERESRFSMIKANTYFNRLEQAFKLKIAPLFAPLNHLLKQT